MEPREPILSVYEANQLAARTLENGPGPVWIEGEVSELRPAASGHVYFTLIDGRAQARVVFYRSDRERLGVELVNGAKVRLYAVFSLYEPRGAFQLIVRELAVVGDGSVAEKLAALRKKLAAEGLFDPARKRPLPRVPRRIAVVTSRDGAALHDIVKVAFARFPTRLVVFHTLVTGPEAPLAIVEALRSTRRLRTIDVIILARGGGAAEDLVAFNDERVARAIAAAHVPVVTGVGHQTDVTLADLVADHRAATPSNAAELVVPLASGLRDELRDAERALERALDRRVGRERLLLERLEAKLVAIGARWAGPRGELEGLTRALERGARQRLTVDRRRLDVLAERLTRLDPRARLTTDRRRLAELEPRLLRALEKVSHGRRRELDRLSARLEAAIVARLGEASGELRQVVATLDAISPLAVLGRGYAIVEKADGAIVRRASDVTPGDALAVRLHEGRLGVTVTAVTRGAPEDASEPAPDRA